MRLGYAITFCFPMGTVGMTAIGAIRYDGWTRVYFLLLLVPAVLVATYLYLDAYLWATSTRRALPAPKKHVGTDSPLHETANSLPSPDSSRPVSTDREEGEQVLGASKARRVEAGAVLPDYEWVKDHPTASIEVIRMEFPHGGHVRDYAEALYVAQVERAIALGQYEGRERALAYLHEQLAASTSSADALPQTPSPEHEQVEAGKQDVGDASGVVVEEDQP